MDQASPSGAPRRPSGPDDPFLSELHKRAEALAARLR